MKKKKNDSLLMHTNIMGNLPKNPGKKPWYKKKSRIIIISSIFGVIVITASVALPLFWFQNQLLNLIALQLFLTWVS